MLGKNDNPKTCQFSKFLKKIFSYLNVIIFAHIKEQEILYSKYSSTMLNLQKKYSNILDSFELTWNKEKVFIQINNIKEIFIDIGIFNLVNCFSKFISIFFCTLPEADFSNNYESFVKWTTIDIILRDCFIFKKLICRTFYSKKSYRTGAGFKTVKDYLTSCKEVFRSEENEEDSSLSDSSDSDTENEKKKIDDEYYKMPKASQKFNEDFLEMQLNEEKFSYFANENNSKKVSCPYRIYS